MNALLKGLGPTPQLIIFGALVLTLIGLGSVAAMVAASVVFDIPFQDLPLLISQPEPKYAHALIWMNNITQLVGFALPVLLFFVLFSGEPIHNLMLNKGNIILLLAPVIIASAAPLIDLSSFINGLLIPENSWLERTFKPTEELAERMTNMFMEPSSNVPIAVAFLSIAIIPALCEELVFRGVIMPLLSKATRNIHIAIWATAFLFSLIHMQFYGFLPRMIMGGLLGYLVVWSGSLWASILAHFINNATAFYMFRLYGTMETPENSLLNHWLFYMLASAVFVMLVWLAWKKRVPVAGCSLVVES
ncbi:MAG: type II CAAX prenyl endopeptidase Rce1 family protein [Flavobacteriales bacterium]